MLKVTFEIVPHGNEDHPSRRAIGVLRIGLKEVTDDIGQYTSQITTDGRHEPLVKEVEIDDHSRKKGAFELVRRCLEAHLDKKDMGDLIQRSHALMEALAAQYGTLEQDDPGPSKDQSPIEDNFIRNEQPTKDLIHCAACENTNLDTLMGVQYSHDSPYHYDGISEWSCSICGTRTGRWSGRVLGEGEFEKRCSLDWLDRCN